MYTTENMGKRKGLKTNEIVVDAIKEFIREECDCERNGSISRENYFKIFMKIGMILRPGFEADELQRIVREDFDTDCQDKDEKKEGEEGKENGEEQDQAAKTFDSLDGDKLFNAFFSLADVWCPSTNEHEYAEFFKTIKHRLKYQGSQDPGAYDGVL